MTLRTSSYCVNVDIKPASFSNQPAASPLA